ncbi:porin [Acidocella sp.]|jgi:hypothetical protein|uniref:porin n=1 Tax=Acidocella sp. TaxID=50710 RepID=UPI002F427F75
MRKLLLASAATMGALLVTVGGAQAQPVSQPAPGTIAVHLNGYLQFSIGDFGSTLNSHAGNKLNPITTDGDARLYGGFDAQTLNGINYGAQIELRTTKSNAGESVGSNSTSTAGTSSFYVKRAYGYIGTSEAGYVRLGQTDSAFSLFQTGVLEGFGDGAQWNTDGGLINALPTQVVPSTFIYADASALYATDKVVYLSPSIAGFSVAAGYEPSSNGLKEGTANCVQTSLNLCSNISSTNVTQSLSQRKNTIDAAVQYSGDLGGFATKANLGIINAAPVNFTGVTTAASAAPFGVKEMTVYQAGVQSSYAGVTLGAAVKWGAVENGYAFVPKGSRNGLAYIVNGTYVVGPYVVGASVFDEQSAGGFVAGSTADGHFARTLSEYGVATGANYVVGKDLTLFVQYMYGHQHQPGNTGLGNDGNTQVQVVSTGATFKW